ncbi:MAG: hypothetical protein PHT80_08870, partial [Lentisphaeria bacterium]|nr:hypothetical protein [Lentisphaeria bacterium]
VGADLCVRPNPPQSDPTNQTDLIDALHLTISMALFASTKQRSFSLPQSGRSAESAKHTSPGQAR